MSEFFYLKIFGFLEVKFSIYLNRPVFVMWRYDLGLLMSKFHQFMKVLSAVKISEIRFYVCDTY